MLRSLMLSLVVVACSTEAEQGPAIASLAPEAAAIGDPLDIFGDNFCGDAGVAYDGGCVADPVAFVAFGQDIAVEPAAAIEWSDSHVRVEVPSALEAGSRMVTITVDGVVSNAHDFVVLLP